MKQIGDLRKMKTLVIYIHGKGGNAKEAEHYKMLFKGCDVVGFDYASQTPWEAKEEFSAYFDSVCKGYDSVELIANSIGAFFAMNALSNKKIRKAYFISPIVDMEKLIYNMMAWANVTEDELMKKKEIKTDFGETLAADYLFYVKKHPIRWTIPTFILYGENDNLTDYKTISKFAKSAGASLTVMKGGKHWFHTDEQMAFLDEWILNALNDSKKGHTA